MLRSVSMRGLFVIIGILGIMLRIWLTEGKLKEYLKYERLFTSRILSLYTFLAFLNMFTLTPLNIVIVCAFPMMVICFFRYDLPFIIDLIQMKPVLPDNHHIINIKLKLFLMIERLTVHTPIIILGGIWYFQGLKGNVLAGLTQVDFIFAILFVLIPFFFIDPRITQKKEWPDGLWLFIGALCSMIGFYLHFFIIFL